nr:unnamed protein product [Digitaria exilis]
MQEEGSSRDPRCAAAVPSLPSASSPPPPGVSPVRSSRRLQRREEGAATGEKDENDEPELQRLRHGAEHADVWRRRTPRRQGQLHAGLAQVDDYHGQELGPNSATDADAVRSADYDTTSSSLLSDPHPLRPPLPQPLSLSTSPKAKWRHGVEEGPRRGAPWQLHAAVHGVEEGPSASEAAAHRAVALAGSGGAEERGSTKELWRSREWRSGEAGPAEEQGSAGPDPAA